MTGKMWIAEQKRLSVLHQYHILDTLKEAEFDSIAKEAANVCEVPFSAISFVDSNRVWFKSTVGLNVAEIPRDEGFCNYTIQNAFAFYVRDASEDQRFSEFSSVVNSPYVRFYCGIPLINKEGYAVGALCVLDRKPRDLTDTQIYALKILADRIVVLIEARSVGSGLKEYFLQQENILNNLASPLAIVDLNDRIEWVNREWEYMLGWTTKELIGQEIGELFLKSEEDKEWVRGNLEGTNISREMTIKGNGGDPHVIWTLLKLAGGRKLVSLREIPQSKMQNPETEVQTRIMHTARLSIMGEMAAGIVHEINNPLCIISAQLQVLSLQCQQKHTNVGDFAEKIIQLSSVVQRMIGIVSVLRSFARASDQDPFQIIPINRVVTEALDICRIRSKKARVDLNIDFVSDEVTVECCPIQLSQVVVNLVNNAIDAVCNLKEKWIRCRIADLGDSISVSVIDAGHGISPEVRAHLMEPFFTTKAEGKGTGLGLSLAKKFMQNHGGTLELDTQGAHTTFVMKFPKRQKNLSKESA